MCFYGGQETSYQFGQIEMEKVWLSWFEDEVKKEGVHCTVCDEEIESKTFYHSHDSAKHYCNRCFGILKPFLEKVVARSDD